MSPDFSQRYDYCSVSTSFLSKLRGNCPCILFPCHLSFVFSAMLSIFLVSFCPSVLRHLAVCNTAESVLCWYVLTTCISGSSFLSAYSTNFVIYTASSPFLPVFWGHTSDLHLLLGDAVHECLVVSLFSSLVL